MTRDYVVLLIENSNSEHNKIRLELAPLIRAEEAPHIHLVYTGQYRPGSRQDISADEAMEIVSKARKLYDLAIVDLGLRPVYAQKVHDELLKAPGAPDQMQTELLRSLDGLIVIVRLRQLFPALPIIVFSQYARYPVVQDTLRRLLREHVGREDFLTFLPKDEEHYPMLRDVVRQELASGGTGVVPAGTPGGFVSTTRKIVESLIHGLCEREG